jgi:hypothetical protein
MIGPIHGMKSFWRIPDGLSEKLQFTKAHQIKIELSISGMS